MSEVTYLEAIREALFEEMERDPNVFCLGEDIGGYGGAFKVTDGLMAKYGEQRVIDTPISEAAIIGAMRAPSLCPTRAIRAGSISARCLNHVTSARASCANELVVAFATVSPPLD